jgi:acetyl-CoA acyltransferase
VRFGLDAVGTAARAIKAGEAELIVAGGVESMSRAPFVMGKAEQAFSRAAEVYDTTIGWRFVNKALDKQYGTESMMETAENIAREQKHQPRRPGCLCPLEPGKGSQSATDQAF